MTWLLLTTLACAGDPKSTDKPTPPPPLKAGQAEAIFAMGCFWCGESDFEHLPGVIDAVSGYAGSERDAPTYHTVSTGLTGYTEAVRVVYDPKKLDYATLLDYFWHHIDPTDGGGQFCDRGSEYRSAVFPIDDAQRSAAVASRAGVEATLGQPVATQVENVGKFWVAEAYHQNFWKTNPDHYQRYRAGCGRDAKVAAVWANAAK